MLPPSGKPVFSLTPAGKKEERQGAIPSWLQATGSKPPPLVRRPLGSGPLTIGTWLASVKPKDMAVLSLGVVLLLGAPLMEIVFLGPEGKESAMLKKDFGQAPSAFADMPTEEGVLGLAQGGLVGAQGERVTPLSGRDSTLLMDPQMRGQGGERPEGAPAAKGGLAGGPADGSSASAKSADEGSAWKDVLTAAKSGVVKAAKAAGLPRPIPKLASTLGGLSGLGGGGGGSSGSKAEAVGGGGSLAAPTTDKLFSGPKVNQSPIAKAVAGYRGAASRGLESGRNFSLSQLEAMSSKSGAYFDRHEGINGIMRGPYIAQGSDFEGRYAAEATLRAPGSDDPTKPASSKDQKSITINQKEDLAKLRQKLEMQKAIDLKWDKKRYDELDRKKMIEQIVAQTLAQTAQQAFLKILDKLLGNTPQKAQGQQVQ